MKVNDVVIIGGGPAGISCAVQLTRYGIKPLILEKENLGGLLLNANYIENYPGFPEGIKGPELTELLKKQLEKNKIKISFEEVLALSSNKRILNIKTDKNIYYSKFAVIASGTKPKKFKDCIIPEEINTKIFYEVYNLKTLKNKKIAIVGSGDAAFDYAIGLGKHNEIIILNRKEKSKCIPILFDRVKKSRKIKYMTNIKVKNIKSSDNIILLECITSKGVINIKIDYLIFAIGRVPCLDFLSEDLKKKLSNRLYLAGDVKNGIFRQVCIASGDGMKIAMQIYSKMRKNNK
jgi:thioredoxin reductase